jgi:hypothetical protein
MPQPKIVCFEEHFTSPKLRELRGEKDSPLQRKLDDLGVLRIRATDDAGIDLQVISENNPATQNLDAETAVKLARASNDVLHEAVRAHPGRFAGFATLPTPDPKAAADELERAVSKLGFKGAMIMGLTHGRFMDDKKFRPIFERAAALDVPVYIHPTPPHPAVMDAYFKDYPVLSGAPLGFTLETLTIPTGSSSAACSMNFRRSRSSSDIWVRPRRSCCGAPPTRWAGASKCRARSATITGRISGLPSAALFPMPRLPTRSPRWASSALCFRSTGRSRKTCPAENGWTRRR